MVEFNPDIKDADIPYYGKLSTPIGHVAPRSFTADTSKGAALKGIGDTLEVGAKVADELERGYIRKRATDVFTPQVEEHINDLEGMASNASQAARVPTDTETDGESLTTSGGGPSGPTLPPSAARGIKQAETLKAGVDAGKYSPAAYTSRLYALSQKLKSEVPPGYWDVLSHEIHKVTAEPTANANAHALIAQINTAAGAAEKDRTKLESEFYQNYKMPGVAQLHLLYRNRQISEDKARLELGNIQVNYYESERKKNAVASLEADDKTGEIIAGRAVSEQANVSAGYYFKNAVRSAGFDPDTEDGLSKFGDWVKDLPKDKAQALLAGLETAESQWATAVTNYANRPLPKDAAGNPDGKKTFASVCNTCVENALKGNGRQQFTAWKTLLKDGDVSPIKYTERMLKDIQNDEKLGIYNTAEGRNLIRLHEISAALGPQATDFYIRDDALNAKVKANVKTLLRVEEVSLLGGVPDPKTGEPPSLKSSAEKLSQEGDDGKGLTRLVEHIRQIRTPPRTPEDKVTQERAVEAAFHPRNFGLIARMPPDGGKHIYEQLTDRQMTDAIYNLGPKAWDTYSNWAKSTFSNEVLAPRVRELNTIQADTVGKATVAYNDGDGTIAPKFKVVVNGPETAYTRSVKSNVESLNKSLEHVHNIVKKEGGDTNAKIYEWLVGLGYNNGPAGAMRKAIKASATPPVEEGIPQ